MNDFLWSRTADDYSILDACCGSQESLKRNDFAKAFTDFSGDDNRLAVADLPRFLESVFVRQFADEEVEALARRVGSYTVYASIRCKLGNKKGLTQTLSFEECEYLVDVCRARGYNLR